MRPKFQHENSYACLLAEVLEEEGEAEEKSPVRGDEKRADLAAKHSSVDLAFKQSRPRRRIGAATSTSTEATPISTPPPPLLPLLVERDDPSLPECLKFNRFIQTGYRRAPLSKKECICSLGYAHNETFNVLSHLVPLVFICVALATGALSATWSLPVLLCLAGSVCYHLFMADSRNYSRYLSVDVCGVLALTIDGTRAMASRPAACVAAAAASGNWLLSPLALLREALLVAPWAAAAAGSPPSLSSLWSRSLLARDAALVSYAALVVLAAAKALRGRTAAERGLPLLALLVARFAVLAARAAEVRSLVASAAAAASSSSSSSSLPAGVASLRSALRWYAGAEAASFVGGLINVLRVPERWAKPLPPRTSPAPPTKTTTAAAATAETETEAAATKLPPPRFRLVDFALNSHSLMHVFSLVALGCYHAAAAEDRKHWLEHGCGTG